MLKISKQEKKQLELVRIFAFDLISANESENQEQIAETEERVTNEERATNEAHVQIVLQKLDQGGT